MIWSRILDIFRAARPPLDLAANRARAVARARSMARVRSTYVLGTGGRDPRPSSPFTKRNGHAGSDCVGFTSWCLGHDRFQPESFPYYDGWINTDSLMMDARGEQSWYAEVKRPEPGDVVVFPSVYKDGKRLRMGHIGLVVEVPADLPEDVYALPKADRHRWLFLVKIIDCAAASRRKPYAIGETRASVSWDKPDAMFARCVRA